MYIHIITYLKRIDVTFTYVFDVYLAIKRIRIYASIYRYLLT